MLRRVAIHRAVRNVDSLAGQKLMHLGQLQAPLSLGAFQPLLEAIMMGTQRLFRGRDLARSRARLAPLRHPRRQRLIRRDLFRPALFLRLSYIRADRLSATTGRHRYPSLALPPVVPFQYIQNFPHTVLPVCQYDLLVSKKARTAELGLKGVGS